MKGIPETPIFEYVMDTYYRIIRSRLYNPIDYNARNILEEMLTDYISTAMTINNIGGFFDMPIAVHFGKNMLPWHFLCASINQWERQQFKNRNGFSEFRHILRRYGLLVKAQEMLLGGVTDTLKRHKEGETRNGLSLALCHT